MVLHCLTHVKFNVNCAHYTNTRSNVQ